MDEVYFDSEAEFKKLQKKFGNEYEKKDVHVFRSITAPFRISKVFTTSSVATCALDRSYYLSS